MHTHLIYQEDSYVKRFTANVVAAEGNNIILDRTAFYPTTGGITHDTGKLIHENTEYEVIDVKLDRNTGEVIHVLNAGANIPAGSVVEGVLNWERRYKLMRLHTATHIIAAVMFRDYNALITGGHINVEYAKDDFSIEQFDRTIFEDVVKKANEIIKQGIEVKVYWLNRQEAMKIPGIVKLASRLPPTTEKLRIVEIPGVDIQADGGPHVRNTLEIGEIVLLKVENRGKRRKRMYYTVRS
jgi:misacylated tRNA(Ala) deacylase